MPFLFENIFGILLGIFSISFIACVKGVMKDKSEKEMIVELSLFIVWYLITVALNRFFPTLGILHENKITYVVISIVMLESISLFIDAHTYY